MFIAAQRDRADVVAFLLDLGVPLEIEDRHKQRTLHEAASYNALRVATLLIERGAEIDPRETQWNATPIGFASYGEKIEMIDLLSRFSKNVWALAYRGCIDRLREVLQAEPALATVTSSDGTTPLWWLPDDDVKAMEIATLLMAHGADPSARSKDGETAADSALERGMLEVAQLLAVDGGRTPSRRRSPRLQTFEDLAQALLFAFETGHPASMQRLQEHVRTSFTWDELRANVRARLEALSEAERPDGYFALPHARLLVARQAGYENWEALAKACS